MIRAFAIEPEGLRAAPLEALSPDRPAWIDLYAPSAEERRQIAGRFGLFLPSREEMEEIEISSRLYRRDGALYMTAVLPAGEDGVSVGPVVFILHRALLVTLRHLDPAPFGIVAERLETAAPRPPTAAGVLLALLDGVVDRLADTLEATTSGIDRLSARIFRHASPEPRGGEELRSVLGELGRRGTLLSDIRESLVSLQRLVLYCRDEISGRENARRLRSGLETLSADIASLADHAGFLSQEIGFLLDATLGFINIEQNTTIKIFSVIAVIFLPPTLVASIYGMNFRFMPELSWVFGYPLALLLMLLSALLPYRWFKRRGWL